MQDVAILIRQYHDAKDAGNLSIQQMVVNKIVDYYYMIDNRHLACWWLDESLKLLGK